MLHVMLNLVLFAMGVFALYKGSDVLVTGTSKTASRLGVSSLIISLTIVAYGTSAPELATSLVATLNSHTSLAVGNVIGSCLANILLVLGISSIVRPISVSKSIVRRELPVLLSATSLFSILTYFDLLNPIGGVFLLVSFLLFLSYFIKAANVNGKKNDVNFSLRKGFAMIILGIISVVLGAHLLVQSSVFFARWFGVPEFIIAVSLVAIGTSIPELAVSVTAAWKREWDISVGNLLGSNVFNTLLIVGLCSLFSKLPVDSKTVNSSFLLIGITILLFPILYTGRKISRVEGIFLIVIYIIYMWFVFQ